MHSAVVSISRVHTNWDVSYPIFIDLLVGAFKKIYFTFVIYHDGAQWEQYALISSYTLINNTSSDNPSTQFFSAYCNPV